MLGRMLMRLVLGGAVLMTALSAGAQSARVGSLKVPEALGANIHFTDPKPGEMQMLADAGFKVLRMDFTWGATEGKKGEYDFAAYERLLKAMEPHGMRALFILDYSNRLYDEGKPPHTAEGRAAMAKWAAAAVNHFKGKGILWEMWNEPNIAQFWPPRPSADDYAKLAIEVGKAIKSTAREELYIGPATSKVDLVFLEECLRAGCLEYWDCVSVHPYRQKAPETVNEEYRALRSLIRQYAPAGKTIPILSGEWGYSAAWRGFDAERQGKYLPRQWLVNLYNEIPLSIWYDWHDDGPDPKEPEHHFGTVLHPYKGGQLPVYEPKPAYLAARTLTSELKGLQYNKRLALEHPEDYCLLFWDGGERVAMAVWTAGSAGRAVTIPASGGQFRVNDHLGRHARTIDGDAKGVTVVLSDAPQYLAPLKRNEALLAAARWRRVSPDTWVKAPANADLDEVTMPVERGHEPHRVRVRLTLPRATFAQETLVGPSNPIRIEPLPVIGNELVFDVDNPGGEAFEGEIRLENARGLEPADWRDPSIRLEGGEKSATVSYPLVRSSLGYEVRYEVWRNRRGERVHVVTQPAVTRRFRAVDDLTRYAAGSPVDAYVVVPEGDKAVRSEHALTHATAPRPLPNGLKPAALKLTYSFADGWKYLRVAPVGNGLKRVEGKPRKFAVWLYGDGSGNVLKLRFVDSAGQTFQPEGRRIDFMGWKYVTIPMDGGDATHWGPRDKPGDGQIHYPVGWDTLFLIDNPGRRETRGELYFAAPTLIE